jgi:hypothetical protein
MKKRTASILISSLALAAILLSACGAAATSKGVDEGRGFGGGAPELGISAEQPATSGDFVSADTSSSTSTDRLVIKNANLSIVVDDPKQSMDDITALAKQLGGFVVSSYLYQSTLANGMEVPSASITIRVPAESLDRTLEKIQSNAKTVLTQNISGQDVTAEYTDLQSRLRNLQAAEVLLRQIMDEATKTEDILNAFNQLNSITEQIEVLKGQIKYYEESAALSAIAVDLIASQSVQPITIGGWEPVGVAKDAIQALVNALQAIVNALIWLGLYVLPVALVILVPMWLVVRGARSWSSKRSSKKRK